MIHHFSLSARDPEQVAGVLAEVTGGRVFDFAPFPGSRIVVVGDAHGTAIEVYPFGLELEPGEGSAPVRSVSNPAPSEFTATHAAISVALDEAAIHRIAQRENWRAATCARSAAFQVVEFWLENRVMIEFLTPAMASDYLRAITPANLDQALLQAQGK
jgi:hypothetical protein